MVEERFVSVLASRVKEEIDDASTFGLVAGTVFAIDFASRGQWVEAGMLASIALASASWIVKGPDIPEEMQNNVNNGE